MIPEKKSAARRKWTVTVLAAIFAVGVGAHVIDDHIYKHFTQSPENLVKSYLTAIKHRDDVLTPEAIRTDWNFESVAVVDVDLPDKAKGSVFVSAELTGYGKTRTAVFEAA